MLAALLSAALLTAAPGPVPAAVRAPAPGSVRPTGVAAPAAKPAPPSPPAKPAVPPLADALLAALREAQLEELHDAGQEDGRCPGDPDCAWPLPRSKVGQWIDLAVIRLDADGRAVEAANVQVDPGAPQGRVVKLDRDLGATGVRFRRWNPVRREAAGAGLPFEDGDDIAPLRGPGGVDFMAPYPASVFKLLLAFHVERRVAGRALSLDVPLTELVPPPAPGQAVVAPETRPLGAWLEAMITESDNRATKVVLRHLHDLGEMDRLNRDLIRLGLDTLRIDGTNPEDGTRWAPGEIHATAMDLARLLWLVAGGPGVMWRTPRGTPVTRAELPEPARRRLQTLLADQGFHDTLSSTSLCGEVPPGIPARVPLRFVDPATGQETVGEAPFGRDVRPCNDAAEVRFLHKTGLTWNYAADAGLVEALPGKAPRRYVVALVSSLGVRFVDPERAAAPRHPCTATQLCVDRRLARLGAAIDAHAVQATARDRRRPRPPGR